MSVTRRQAEPVEGLAGHLLGIGMCSQDDCQEDRLGMVEFEEADD